MGLHDRRNQPLRMFAHVRIRHPRHAYYGLTGTIIRIDATKRKVWVSLPGGTVTAANALSVEVIVPRTGR